MQHRTPISIGRRPGIKRLSAAAERPTCQAGHGSCMHWSGWKRIGDHHTQADHVITSTHQGGAENRKARELKRFGRIPTGAFQQVQVSELAIARLMTAYQFLEV